MFLKICLILNFHLYLLADGLNLDCKDEENRSVDWFVAYLLPLDVKSQHQLVRAGEAYLYITNNTASSGWTLSKNRMRSGDSMITKTYAPFYEGDNEQNFWILYNNNPPLRNKKLTISHSKGSLIMNDRSGFWIIHNEPKFPPKPLSLSSNNSKSSAFSFPLFDAYYGQQFLCVSLNSKQFGSIGEQLSFQRVVVYQSNVPKKFEGTFTSLIDVARHRYADYGPLMYTRKTTIVSRNGQEFVSYAKTGQWGKDLYKYFIAKDVNDDLFVQSWLNKRNFFNSSCDPPKVEHVKQISIDQRPSSIKFPTSIDHSKWAVTQNINNNRNHFVCISDLNRDQQDTHKSGGALCFKNTDVWRSYINLIDTIDDCNNQ